jgi:hypothetical protein
MANNTHTLSSRTETFYTNYQNQQFVRNRVIQSANKNSDADFVTIVINEQFVNLPAGRLSGQRIEVSYSYDRNQTARSNLRDESLATQTRKSWKLSTSSWQRTAL